MSNFRIQKIQITGLFDDINYDINLNEHGPISIITAPNGRGKTTMLNILAFVLNPTGENFKAFRGVPFRVFKCFLSNGKTIEFERIAKDRFDKRNPRMARTITRDPESFRTAFIMNYGDFHYAISSLENRNKGILFSNIVDEFMHEGPEAFFDADDIEIAYMMRRNRSEFLFRVLERKIVEYLKENDCWKSVNFIRANRIQPVTIAPRRSSDYDEYKTQSPLQIACEKISEDIKAATEEYSQAVSQAKDKLPRMFLEGRGGSLDSKQFLDGWGDYSNELKRFQEIGLIAPTDDFTQGKDIPSVYETKGQFLSTYLEAFKDTTKPLRGIYERLKLFKSILDGRNAITGKKAVFSKDGISLFVGSREIQLDTLSSGEKHDFIMFYNLIFNIDNNGLVLIDEPEISLHIEWQESYLDHLIAICEMNGLQAIVATHSPNIVSSHYDCLVEKGETHG